MAVATPAKRIKSNGLALKPKEVFQLFSLSSQLADWAEDFLEERRRYTPEFLRSIRKALNDVRKGRVRKIESLWELAG